MVSNTPKGETLVLFGGNLLESKGKCLIGQDFGPSARDEPWNDERGCPELDVGSVESSTHDGDRLKVAWT